MMSSNFCHLKHIFNLLSRVCYNQCLLANFRTEIQHSQKFRYLVALNSHQDNLYKPKVRKLYILVYIFRLYISFQTVFLLFLLLETEAWFLGFNGFLLTFSSFLYFGSTIILVLKDHCLHILDVTRQVCSRRKLLKYAGQWTLRQTLRNTGTGGKYHI